MCCFTSRLSKSHLFTKINGSNIGRKTFDLTFIADSEYETSRADGQWETAAWDRGCFKRTQTASWVRSDIQQKHLEKFRVGQEVLWLSDHRFLHCFPALNMLNDASLLTIHPYNKSFTVHRTHGDTLAATKPRHLCT